MVWKAIARRSRRARITPRKKLGRAGGASSRKVRNPTFRNILVPSRSSRRVDVRMRKGSAGASPAASGATPLASEVDGAHRSASASRKDASGEAPNAAGEAPALPFSHWSGARVPLGGTAEKNHLNYQTRSKNGLPLWSNVRARRASVLLFTGKVSDFSACNQFD